MECLTFLMSEEALFGWLITVAEPEGGPPVVYNVAILDERLAVGAVRRILPHSTGSIVKVKSKLTQRLFKALRMKPGDVMVGAKPRRKPPNPRKSSPPA
jgi:hypothetical protein